MHIFAPFAGVLHGLVDQLEQVGVLKRQRKMSDKMLFAGQYGWWNLTGDWKKHLLQLKRIGVTGIRIFGQFSWPEGRGTYTPFQRITNIKRIDDFLWVAPPPGDQPRRERYFEKDGYVWFKHRQYPNVIFPVYDLAVVRAEYMLKLEELCLYLKSIDMTLIWEMEDWCSLKHGGVEKYRHPYFVSPQAHSSATPGGLFGESLRKYMKLYWNAVIEVFELTDVNVILSVMNEYDFHAPKQGLDPIDEKAEMLGWYDDSISIMSKDDLSMGFIGSAGRYQADVFDLCDMYSPHGIGNAKSYDDKKKHNLSNGLDITKDTGNLLLSGDGFSTGTGRPDFKGRRGITLNEVPWISHTVNNLGYLGYEALIRYSKGHANGTFEDFDREYAGYAICGALAKNLGLPTWEPPITPPAPPPKPIEPIKPPPGPISWFQKLLQGLGRFLRNVLDRFGF